MTLSRDNLKMHTKKGILILLALVLYFSSYSQPTDIRLIKIQGGNVNFIANTYDKYKNGIQYPITTTLEATFQVDGALGWQLYAWAGENSILSDNGETLNLTSLKLTVEDFTTTDDGTLSVTSPFTLTDDTSKVLVAQGSGGDPTQVNINFVFSYLLGSEGELMNKEEGFYYVDIYFQLVQL